MSTSADDHAEEGLKGLQIVRGSIHDESQLLDDDCVSENSFGSSLFGDNAVDEENMAADIELDPSLPSYFEEEYPQPDDMSPAVDLSVVPQYTPPTKSTQPAFNVEFLGPPMCVVRGLFFNPALASIN